MDPQKTIHIIHATDADQHLGHLKKILEELKNEKRIDSYSALESDAINENSLEAMGADDMVITLLTNGIEPVKTSIEEIMHKAKLRLPNSKAGEIIVDSVPYDNQFIAFPADLKPIRSREDMDGVWSKIGATLREIFPIPEEPIPPVPWKKYLPYIIGALVLIGLFILIPSPDEEEFKIMRINTAVIPVEGTEGECPRKFDFQGTIKVNAPGEIVYTWVRSDSLKGVVDTLKFDAAGEQQIQSSWTLGTEKKKYEAWQQLKIISPIDTTSNQASFAFECKGKVVPGQQDNIPTLNTVTATAQLSGSARAIAECGKKYQFNFTGEIKSNGKGKVDYIWIGNDGKKSAVKTVVFQKAESKSVSTDIYLEANSQKGYAGWQQLKIVSPSGASSQKAEFLLMCKATTPPVSESGYMHNSILVQTVAKDARISTALTERTLESFVIFSTQYLEKGAGISLDGLGSLWVTENKSTKTNQVNYSSSSNPGVNVKFINKTTLAALIARKTKISVAEANGIIDSFIRYVADRLKSKGLGTTLENFGSWVMISYRPARKGKNPSTGQIIEIKEKRVFDFKANKMLMTKINS